MKIAQLCALPLAFAFCFVAHAENVDVNINSHHAGVSVNDHHGRHEYRMRVTRRGDRYVGFYNNREYVLRGDAVRNFNTDGEYTVYGDIGADNTYIETSELAPVVVESRPEVIRDREVIVEHPRREVIVERHDEPLIKVGPLRIGN